MHVWAVGNRDEHRAHATLGVADDRAGDCGGWVQGDRRITLRVAGGVWTVTERLARAGQHVAECLHHAQVRGHSAGELPSGHRAVVEADPVMNDHTDTTIHRRRPGRRKRRHRIAQLAYAPVPQTQVPRSSRAWQTRPAATLGSTVWVTTSGDSDGEGRRHRRHQRRTTK